MLGMFIFYFCCKLIFYFEFLYFILGGFFVFKLGIDVIVIFVDIDNDFVNDIIVRVKYYKRYGY